MLTETSTKILYCSRKSKIKTTLEYFKALCKVRHVHCYIMYVKTDIFRSTISNHIILLNYCLPVSLEYCGIISSTVLHLELGQAKMTKLVWPSVIPTIWMISGWNMCLQYGQRTFNVFVIRFSPLYKLVHLNNTIISFYHFIRWLDNNSYDGSNDC